MIGHRLKGKMALVNDGRTIVSGITLAVAN